MADKPPFIPILDLSAEVDQLMPQVTAALESVLKSTRFILGPEEQAFETEAAAALGLPHGIGCNSGTDALIIALRAAGIGCEHEVITSSFTFFATAEAITLVGATPVFVDIDPASFNLDANQIEAAITDKTRGIMPVHLFGHAAEMDTIMAIARKHDLRVIEDTAQAWGGTYKGQPLGAIGDIGAFSFFPTKNLGAYGDAGLIATADDDLAEQARMLRVHGSKERYKNDIIGYNSRMDEIQAAILRIKLPLVADYNQARRRIADRYTQAFKDVEGITPPSEAVGVEHVYHQYTVRIHDGRRDQVHAAMQEAGVGCMIYYPIPVHRQKAYAMGHLDLPETDKASAQVMSLPIWPQLDAGRQDRVIQTLIDTLNA